ncbi:hypothetical protein G7054_g8739 [Neopestalotiopsis clavispora]|nr:hypothetical protein G7054_g8739 [Neopestalotiopsis clavispora]
MYTALLSLPLLAASVAAQAENLYTATATADVAAARATAKTSSPTSNVKGAAFDRFVVIWLENTDYDMAAENLAWLASKGITLSGYHAVTHPSEPNYVAAIGGDYFGMQNDNFNQIDANVSTVIDLLEDKGITWAEYQEDMPYTGFEGMAYVNQETGANDYVRKHNPAVIYDANAGKTDRLSLIKNLTLFYDDLENETLPQWMFITPNMTSDGHDTDVTTAGTWTRDFLEPLLDDERFMQNTLVLVTFDENESYSIQNKILGILLGDAVPTDLRDRHRLGQLGPTHPGPLRRRANVFSVVADKTGDVIREWTGEVALENRYFNYSYAGQFNTNGGNSRYPGPQLGDCGLPHNRTVLPSIKEAWYGNPAPVYYDFGLEIPDGLNPPTGYAPVE